MVVFTLLVVEVVTVAVVVAGLCVVVVVVVVDVGNFDILLSFLKSSCRRYYLFYFSMNGSVLAVIILLT